MGNIFIQIITQRCTTWKPGLMQGWDVSGNDCYIIGPPGDLCAALLGRNWSSGATLGSGWQGTRWAGVFSSFALSLSEVMLTKQHFEFSLPAGRCSSLWGGGRVIPQETVQGRWILEALWKWRASTIAGCVFSHVALNRKVFTPNPVYSFCWLSLVFLHPGEGTGTSAAACE